MEEAGRVAESGAVGLSDKVWSEVTRRGHWPTWRDVADVG
jgi:hypothetical protein